MKCPKCSYISFDFNQVCPKCTKDISVEQAKLYFPAFRPDTPAMLGMLIGEADDSGVDIQMSTSTGVDTGEHGMDEGIDDSGSFDSDEMDFEDSQEFDIGLEEEGVDESPFGSEGLESSTGEAEILTQESVSDFEFEGDEEEITMESGEISVEETGAEEVATTESALEEDELGIDLESIASEVEDTTPEAVLPGEEEVALNLDDLKIDESGELKLDEDAESSDELEKALEAADISLEEPSHEGETPEEMELDSGGMDIDLEAISRDMEEASEAPKEDDELLLDLDDLDIELDLDEPDQKSS
jgi:hypothetical protein